MDSFLPMYLQIKTGIQTQVVHSSSPSLKLWIFSTQGKGILKMSKSPTLTKLELKWIHRRYGSQGQSQPSRSTNKQSRDQGNPGCQILPHERFSNRGERMLKIIFMYVYKSHQILIYNPRSMDSGTRLRFEYWL